MTHAWWAALGCAGLAGVSELAERRRRRRAVLDRIGWAPWPAIELAAIAAAFVCASLALNA